ncbi:uncharacterized protein LOC125141181 isoform X2 [Tachysurus fulvidraco]|uniref:uncharacterized protein LOC125141181 isoform X2 n=1 Tax=Tachysurus fulvidraco TaxID=1234273 RepID=UPI001FEE9D96|nr:uncharacterized protein LOC125141181 isoform X2 [Tachysurus fulvidraco]
MPRRISPLTDAIYYVTTKSDQTSKLEVKYISSEKGRGIFTLTSFDKGDFVAEYRGEMIDFIESQRRRRIYHDACGVFMFDFKWKGKTWCIDAAKEDGSFGRLVNDDHKHPNCRMKKIEVDRRPHLCLFALKDIKQGQEITYDYGGTDWPWRSKVMEDNPDENNVQEKHPSQSTSLLDHNTATSASVTEQHSSSEDSDEQDMCIPRLRRTKSVFMARHLEYVHSTEKEVTEGCQFPKGSMQRKMFFNDLRHRGNYAHNAAVMKSGEGELVPYRQPQNQTEGTEFMHCAYCQGLFTRKVLWRHMKSCKLSTKDKISRPGKNRVQALCSYAQPVSSNISKALWKTVSHMNLDEITAAVKNDCCIIQVGEHLLNKGGISAKNEAYVRQKLRELGRLLVSGSKVASLKRMEDFLDPQNYMKTVKAVRHACGYDYQTNTYRTPSLAKKHGISLMKLSKLTKAKALINKDVDLAQKVTGFQDVHKEQWCDLISATAARNIEELKWNAPTVLPFTKDVQKLHTFLDKTQDECVKQLSSVSSTKYWSELAKTILTQIILFNRRREGEVSSMPLSAFLTRDTSDPHADVDWALSEVEKKLCRHFSRIVIRGKRGRPVPVLLTPKMLGALELLVKNRETCGVLKENVYLFARPTAMSHYRGLDCIRNFAKHCGADSPYALTSTKLRKQAATLSTVLNLRDTDLDQLANFLGHDIRIHREYYRLPEKTLQLAKVSKVLMALEQGRVGQFKGKNLDEITIDPNEEMELNSDEIMSEEGEKCEEHEDVGVPPVDTEIVHTVEMNSLQRSSKGKTSTLKKRKAWEVNEVTAVERHMKTFIMSCRVPGKLACQNCITAEPLALKDRDWQSVKFYVYNHIVAYKRDLNKND